MKKFIVFFLILILSLGFIIGQCNDSNDDIAYDEAILENENTLEYSNEAKIKEEIVEEKVSNEDNEDEKEITNQIYTINDSIQLVNNLPSLPNQLLIKTAYITSYNNKTKCPNWVSWHLTSDHTDGPYPRKGVPYYDEDGSVIGIGAVTSETNKGDYFVDLEAKSPRQELNDWYNNEYHMSHGHMCPAGDNKWSREAMNQSFLLTNMCPQDQGSNNGDWKKLEEKCRVWAKKYGDIYIVAGPLFLNDNNRHIGYSKIAVPDAFFKVIIRLGKKPDGIGFILPNDASHQSLKSYSQTIDNVERITGFDFFYILPDDIEELIEKSANYNNW